MKLYNLLGLDKEASFTEIKKAYKKLAVKYHPDKNGDKFTEIKKAYNVLINPDKRELYDKLGDSNDEIDINEIFKDLCKSQHNIPDVDVFIKVSLKELYYGTMIKHTVERYNICNECNGRENYDELDNTELCTECKGTTCYKEQIELDIDIPIGAYVGYTIVIENEGNEIPTNKINNTVSRSNINFIIDEIQDTNYKRGLVFPSLNRENKADLLYNLEITFVESICGFKRTIKHVSGKLLNMVYKKHVLNGEYIVYKNKGMPEIDSDSYGDLFIKINIKKQDIDLSVKNRIYQLLTGKGYSQISLLNESNNLEHFDDYEQKFINND